ncbi:MAG: hypothetical protein CSA86_02555 [Arcobacter sp.]|nr:MAG: hypothetical protein CSA86_02555 [Arcobacter sp.]
MEENRQEAQKLIQKVLKEKSFLILTEEEKALIIEVYNDDMKAESKNYKKYLTLNQNEKLKNILVLTLKDYLGSWHISTQEMEEISQYIQDIQGISID